MIRTLLRPASLRTRYLAAALLYFLLLLFLLVVGRVVHSDVGALVSAQGMSAVVGILFTFAWWKDVRHSLGRAAATGPAFVYAAAFGAAGFVIVFFWTLLLTRVLGVRLPTATLLYENEGFGTLFMLLDIALVPACIEELLFRGVAFGLLRRVLPARETIVVTALAFAFLHLSPVSLPHLLLLGVLYGWLRETTGSIYTSLAAHLVHNGLVVAFERGFGLA